jgi:hypothetical protein
VSWTSWSPKPSISCTSDDILGRGKEELKIRVGLGCEAICRIWGRIEMRDKIWYADDIVFDQGGSFSGLVLPYLVSPWDLFSRPLFGVPIYYTSSCTISFPFLACRCRLIQRFQNRSSCQPSWLVYLPTKYKQFGQNALLNADFCDAWGNPSRSHVRRLVPLWARSLTARTCSVLITLRLSSCVSAYKPRMDAIIGLSR